jgi:hypothetical protein
MVARHELTLREERVVRVEQSDTRITTLCVPTKLQAAMDAAENYWLLKERMPKP